MPDAPKQLKVFLCHSSHDKPVVREVYKKLNSEGWIDPWLDAEKLLPGQDWNLEIEKAVETSHIVLVFLSNNSVNKEGYIQRELRLVLDVALNMPEETIFVTPLRLDDCTVPRRLRGWQYADYFPEEERARAYQRLMASFKIRAEKLGISCAPKNANPNLSPKTSEPDIIPAPSEIDAPNKWLEKTGAEENGINRKFDQDQAKKGWWMLGWFLIGASIVIVTTAILLQGDGLFFTGVLVFLAGGVIAFIARPTRKHAP